ncbi:MAG TPA: acyltransferase [Silvibacterium sp.]|nr:acyltransferase [Silvibacterium sp.]
MPRYAYRELEPSREAKEVFTHWIEYLDEEFTKHKEPAHRADIVRDNLRQLLFGQTHAGVLNSTVASELPSNVLQLSLDPRNITLEPEYYGDIDATRYAPIKPLIWFWQMFDRSPVALNHWLGFRFRAMLGKHIFKKIGSNVKIFHGVEFSYGYNLTIEDDCVVHKYVMLDDRGEIVIRKGTSISDYAAVFSHAHDPIDSGIVENRRTEIGPRARITYHASVMAGVNVGEDAMLGALGLATRNLSGQAIYGGIPARQLKTKDQATLFKDRSDMKAPQCD